MAPSVPPPPKSLSLRVPAKQATAEDDWRPAFDESLRALSLRRLRVATVVILVLHVSAFIAVPSPDATPIGTAVRIALIPFMLLLFGATFVTRARRWSRGLVALMLLSLAAFIIFFNAQLDKPFETEALLLLLPAAGTLFPFSLRATVVITGIISALYLWVAYVFHTFGIGGMVDVAASGFYVVAASAIAAVAASVSYRLRESEFRAQLEEQRAHEKAENLLANTLPRSIVERLKRDPGAIADGFDDVTVLFADIANFTELSARLSPEQLVRFLNELFSEADRLSAHHGLEKIKTIGDAYMVAGGLPEPRPDHAEAVAHMALELRALASGARTPLGDPLRIRIGIHSGPVVAGVIGTHKFNYDLWGDTVNIAARMESTAEAGMIQVSAATRERLEHAFLLEERGVVDVKGKGQMTTHVLNGVTAGTLELGAR